jgi:hypothetical protein
VLALRGGNWLQNAEFGLHSFLAPDNPFVRWLLILDLALLLLYVYSVYWVYRDAFLRYRRGAPWAAAAALLPGAGWLFYLLYRISPLVELDRLEAATFNEEEEPWTDYDQYKANRGSELFKELGAFWRKPEGEGYSAQVRLSRLREIRRTLTPEEKAARRAEREAAVHQRREQQQERKAASRQRALEAKQRRSMTAAHGFKFSMSERKQAQVRQQLKLVEDLKRLPREDETLEELIYEMDYAAALRAARDSLQVAQELGDEQGKITYSRYVARLEPLLLEQASGRE